jgi:hypothetical protein
MTSWKNNDLSGRKDSYIKYSYGEWVDGWMHGWIDGWIQAKPGIID